MKFFYFLRLLAIPLFLLFYSCNDDKTTTVIIVNPPTGPEIIHDRDPSWNPLGSTIAYVGGSEISGIGIFVIDTNGQNKHKISDTYVRNLNWSPDGQWLLYVFGGNIYKKKITGDTSTIQLTYLGNNFSPSWSLDGNFIAFDSNIDSPNGMAFVWKMKNDGSGKRRIFYTPTEGEVRKPYWFPDGLRLVVIRSLLNYRSPEVSIIDTNGTSVAVLTNDDEFDRDPRVSLDGDYITWYRDKNKGEICITKTNGQGLQVITNGYSITPNWSPKGDMITYTNTTDGRIWIISKNRNINKKISY
jgi:Tol biopolymer transport system component